MTVAAPLRERALWHPVSAVDALLDRPIAATLLDTPIVLWRSADGAPHAWGEHCPHRGASFTLGRVQGDRLVCGYHGWCFGRDGGVVAIPALPGHVPSASQRARVHGAVEHAGLVWVRLDGEDSAPPPFPAEADPRLRKLTCGPYDVATSAPRIVDNFLDMAHFGFVHDGILGTPDHAGIGDYRVEVTQGGLRATGCKAWQPQPTAGAAGGGMVEYTYCVDAPYTAVLTKTTGEHGAAGADDAIGLFICPVTEETSRVWMRLAIADDASTDATLRAFQDTIFTQDRPILESQRPKRLPVRPFSPGSPSTQTRELHCAADRSGAAYRRYLHAAGIRYGTE